MTSDERIVHELHTAIDLAMLQVGVSKIDPQTYDLMAHAFRKGVSYGMKIGGELAFKLIREAMSK